MTTFHGPGGAALQGGERRAWLGLYHRLRAIVLYESVYLDAAIVDLYALLQLLGELDAEPAEGEREACALRYARALAALSEAEEPGDPFRSRLIRLVLEADNAFSRAAERAGQGADGRPAVPRGLLEQARRDLRTLGDLYRLDAAAIHRRVVDLWGEQVGAAWVPWSELGSLPGAPSAGEADGAPARPEIAARLDSTADWGELAEALAEYYRANGVGEFGRFRAFRWTGSGADGRLEGVAQPDPVRLRDLIGYERERAAVVENTERFVLGYPANNVLLVGQRGTGKSSTVKALLNEYAERGLRLVEVTKEQLGDLPRILRLLRGRPQRFILFIDDLSFEEHETEYKPLKAVLEGAVEPRPENVLLYATSNRRHLVRERHSDRTEVGLHPTPDGDVRQRDTVEEKLSLADRFGLHAIFLAPDQRRYLEIAFALARARGIDLPDDELRARALRWAEWHNGRSGRTARQFVDDLAGELALRARHGDLH